MARIMAFANQKGGVGKTTSAINTAASLGILGRRVLLCDLDPQGNATSGVGVNKRGIKHSVYDAMIGRCSASEAVSPSGYANLSVLPANIDLAGAEIELASDEASRMFRLKTALDQLRGDYDYIVVDCPPSLGILTLNALCAADSLVVTMQCEYFALEGLSHLSSTIRTVKKRYNPALELAGIMITMYDGRLNLSVQVMEEVKRFFPGKVYRTLVPRAVRISEAPSHGMPIYYYDRSSKGSSCYLELAREIDGQQHPDAAENAPIN